MESLLRVFALSFLYVTAKSSHFVSHDFEGNNNTLNDTNNEIVKTIVVDQTGNGNFKTIQSAIDSVPTGNNHWIRIFIRRGIYNEKVIIPKDKQKILMEAHKASEAIIQYNHAGESIASATFRLLAEFFVAINITFKNTYNKEKPITLYREIKIAPAIVIAADKAAFFGCQFVSLQDTVGDLIGRHYFQQCHITGIVDFIWGNGQSLYQSCVINVLGVTTLTETEQETVDGGAIAGFITAQGRESEQDTSGFVFHGCSIVGVGKAFLGRAYRGYSRVLFCNTNMADVIVPQGWDAWSYPGLVNKMMYAEVNCNGLGARKQGRVAWEKTLSSKDISYFTNRKTFLDKDSWMNTLPPHPFYFY